MKASPAGSPMLFEKQHAVKKSLIIFATLLVASRSICLAQPTNLEQITGGHRLAEAWCSSCHILDGQRRGGATGAPAFPAIGQQKGLTNDVLKAFLQVPHARMPDLHLTAREIDQLSSYILSLH
jgi:mono/diheme cytochrome c family protein